MNDLAWIIFMMAVTFLLHKYRTKTEPTAEENLRSALGELVFPDHDSPEQILKHAEKALAELRKGTENVWGGDGVYGCLDHLKHALEADFSYEGIGTTRKEVIEFRNGKSQKILAKKRLEAYRRKPGLTYSIRSLAEDGKFALEDIGTTIDELDAIDRATMQPIYTAHVNDFRKFARGEDVLMLIVDPDGFFNHLVHNLHQNNLTLEDLGTSEAEMHALLGQARKRRAKTFLGWVRNDAHEGNTNAHDPHVDTLREYLTKTGLHLPDIGSSESEISTLRRMGHIKAGEKSLE